MNNTLSLSGVAPARLVGQPRQLVEGERCEAPPLQRWADEHLCVRVCVCGWVCVGGCRWVGVCVWVCETW